MGKFTIAEEAPSSAGQSDFTKATSEESWAKSPPNSVGESDDSFTLKTTQTRRRGRSPANKNKPVLESVAQAPANYALWSQLIIGSANTVVVTWLGTECSMEKREADMLEPPIARILARLTPGQAERVSVFIDPMVMLIALGMWGNRIVRIQRAKRPGVISEAELARASGMTEPVPNYQQPPEPAIPQQKVEINPNGIPVAITNQMGEL